MIEKIIKYIERKKSDKALDEFVTRIAAEIEFEFKTITNEVINIKRIIGIGKLENGLQSAKN